MVYCFKFHKGGDCSGCVFKHACFKCEGSHRALKCNFRALSRQVINQSRGSSHPLNPALPRPSLLELPIPVDSNRLLFFLSGNTPSIVDLLLKGFREGFPIHCEGSRLSCDSPNLKAALQTPDAADAKLCKELEFRKLAGPFSSPPPFFSSFPTWFGTQEN